MLATIDPVARVSHSLGTWAPSSWELEQFSLSARVDYCWQDEIWVCEFNRDPIDKRDGFDVWNAQATLGYDFQG